MKLIAAVAALALVAGSVDVEAQKRGDASNKPGGAKRPGAHQIAPEGADDAGPPPAPLAHIAIATFGEIDLEHRQGLVEAAKEGDEEARQELVAADIEALDEVIEGLDDEGVREWIKFGMALERGKGFAYDTTGGKRITAPESGSALTTIGGSNRAQDAATGLIAVVIITALTEMNDELDKIQERLEGIREAVNANGQVRETNLLDISDR